jgi:hypothetical protein
LPALFGVTTPYFTQGKPIIITGFELYGPDSIKPPKHHPLGGQTAWDDATTELNGDNQKFCDLCSAGFRGVNADFDAHNEQTGLSNDSLLSDRPGLTGSLTLAIRQIFATEQQRLMTNNGLTSVPNGHNLRVLLVV